MPPDGKPFEMFQDDDAACRHFAAAQVEGQAERVNWKQAALAGGGTIIGAGLGAAIGGGQGAAIGAGTGGVGGAAFSAMPASRAQDNIQGRYDRAYIQCMFSRGNDVPGYQHRVRSSRR